MSIPSVFRIVLILSYCLVLTLSEYLNSTIIIDLYLTISSESELIISENELETKISNAFTLTNENNYVYGVDNIDFTFNYNYYNEYNPNNYEYKCILYMYFLTENAYINAVNNGYSKFISNSLNTYIINFETNILIELQLYNINNILINEMKIISLDLEENIGKIIINYNGDITTTNTPTQSTSNPTISPTTIIKTTTNNNNNNNNNVGQTSNYTFSNEGTYWVLLILVLFIGCCIGCCCLYFIFIRIDNIIKQRITQKR
eukprot:218823_1